MFEAAALLPYLANGSRGCAPDDRLRRGIQYAGVCCRRRCRCLLDHPHWL